jgi:ubiquinone/menaquinone biosynthesis C-methylase UbiE
MQVVGADKYPNMIREAKKQDQEIEYVVAPAEELPFPDNTFDAVTAFSAFHWFANKDAGREIRRVLKPGKFFITVNREEKDNFKRQAMDMMREKLAPNRKNKNILEGMKNSGFEDLTERRFGSIEEYSPEEAMEFLRSSAWWKIIPPELEQEISDACREIIGANQTREGILLRKLNFLIVSGS